MYLASPSLPAMWKWDLEAGNIVNIPFKYIALLYLGYGTNPKFHKIDNKKY